MKKYLSLFVVLLMAFSFINVARAEDSAGASVEGGASADVQVKTPRFDGGPTRDGKPAQATLNAGAKSDVESEQYVNRDGEKDDMDAPRKAAQEQMEALKEKIKSEKNAAKAKIEGLRITGREQALQRFDAAVKRIADLKDRISTQITYLSGKGVDVSAATTFVATAGTKLDAAKAKIVEINTLLAGSTNELSKADKTKLRTLSQDTQTLIKDAHKALNDGIKSLKDAVRAKLGTARPETDVKTNTSTNTETNTNTNTGATNQ